ncbi:hydroxyethylthiazole kinase [Aliiruegeria sabulilitoris]|uniref:hydroxyethylthiazole kinase n=1 Tax=Aliiruegeria sabulilitoris TaxID=1510458 RepID=UPI00082FD4BD|nr:hydroxyethylthiazole kinase [Aliiruegeria sabulilitoris]NDR59154.1 hydroxyethylthiazole kinase [Pseudoruegeria sp. M32A2M]
MSSPSQSLAAMRAAAPLVHCITNYVAMNFQANVLLAAGAAPAMVHDPEESGEFAAIAPAVSVNIGTLSPRWVEGMLEAATVARKTNTPWVLDPVACFATELRREATVKLMKLGPSILRGNASEILAIARQDSAGSGVDAGDTVAAAEQAARKVARDAHCIVAVTGEIDFVTDGQKAVRISGGSPLMPQVTATGCSLSALCAAYAAAVEDRFAATVGALSHFAAAGEAAAAKVEGPGGFASAFLDALAAVTPETIGDDRVTPA